MTTRAALITLWVLFVVRGLFYISYLPLWEGFDEWAHYADVQNIAFGLGHSPKDPVSREVQVSLENAPWVDGMRQDAFWRLAESDRNRLEEKIRTIPADWASEPAAFGPHAYEWQPPLYYWIQSGVYQCVAGFSFLSRVWILRLSGLLLASGAIPLAFLLARRLFESTIVALGVAALLVINPELMNMVTHIANDALSVLVGTLTLFAVFEWKGKPESSSRALALGMALGAALLTKAYFLPLAPPIFVYALWTARRYLRQAIVIMATPLALSGWWYASNWLATHSLSGEQIEKAAMASSGFFSALLHMDWSQARNFILITHIWAGNWSFLVVRPWMYRFFTYIAVLAFCGLILRFVGQREALPSRSNLIFLLAIFLSSLASLIYRATQIFEIQGFSGVFGHHLIGVVAGETVLITAGLLAIAPHRLSRAVIPFGVIALAALEFFALHVYAIPYYAGFILHAPDGHLPALRFGEFQNGRLWLLFEHLAVNKAPFLSASMMMAFWSLFVAATLVLIYLIVRKALAEDQCAMPAPPLRFALFSRNSKGTHRKHTTAM